MSTNAKITATVTSYIDPPMRQRMLAVQKRKPRLTISKQVARCIEAHLPQIEASAGLKPKNTEPL